MLKLLREGVVVSNFVNLTNSREFNRYVIMATDNSKITPEFIKKHNIKRGLRNTDGTGVIVGATKIANVSGYEIVEGKKQAREGQLFYRGVNVEELVEGAKKGKYNSFEECCYLLLFGRFPSQVDYDQFCGMLDDCRILPQNYLEDVILNTPAKDVMNKLQRMILTFYSYDSNPDATDLTEILFKIINLISMMPVLISYAYVANQHYFHEESLVIHRPKKGAGTAENILHLIRPTCDYTQEEVALLDLCLTVHAEHGGGNNSAFAASVVASSGTDYYSAICTAIGSLKGPKHGGANKQVNKMISNIKNNVNNWSDKNELKAYLAEILDKKAFDGSGLIYGMGHAVYTISDPRTSILKKAAKKMAIDKNQEAAFELIENIEETTRELMRERKGADFEIPANVDLYSGFVYNLLGISDELFTPIFACARVVGWSAHILEQLTDGRIIRPAYMTMKMENNYMPMSERH